MFNSESRRVVTSRIASEQGGWGTLCAEFGDGRLHYLSPVVDQ